MALQSNDADCPRLATPDTDLQAVTAAWGTLPDAIRRAVVALVEA
jgi:hypothetical protein